MPVVKRIVLGALVNGGSEADDDGCNSSIRQTLTSVEHGRPAGITVQMAFGASEVNGRSRVSVAQGGQSSLGKGEQLIFAFRVS